ncbi:universal stress protein [Oculatella sp. LEGE 06141]|nr:universal stress protein [Oculatella sp. LEGE 06141]MBE9177323.1 universal stress protein [Oculatella sp. LEGE 06141]
MGFQKILAALDYSPLCQLVFDQALELALRNRARLMLFHCLSSDPVAGPPPFSGELGLSPRWLNQAYQAQYVHLEQQIQQTQALLNRYYEVAVQHGVATECDYRIAEPGQGLCLAAKQWEASLIVLGRRGRRGIAEVLFGSVSNYVLHHASCAVLVIQPDSIQAGSLSAEVVSAEETVSSIL